MAEVSCSAVGKHVATHLFYSCASSIVGIVVLAPTLLSFGMLLLFLLLLLVMETKLFDMPSESNCSNPDAESLKSNMPVTNFVMILAKSVTAFCT